MANSGKRENDESKVFTNGASFDLFREIIFSVASQGSQGDNGFLLHVWRDHRSKR
jgi:hypothetical protein